MIQDIKPVKREEGKPVTQDQVDFMNDLYKGAGVTIGSGKTEWAVKYFTLNKRGGWDGKKQFTTITALVTRNEGDTFAKRTVHAEYLNLN